MSSVLTPLARQRLLSNQRSTNGDCSGWAGGWWRGGAEGGWCRNIWRHVWRTIRPGTSTVTHVRKPCSCPDSGCPFKVFQLPSSVDRILQDHPADGEGTRCSEGGAPETTRRRFPDRVIMSLLLSVKSVP